MKYVLPGLPKRNPGLELANAFSVIHLLISHIKKCSKTFYHRGVNKRVAGSNELNLIRQNFALLLSREKRLSQMGIQVYSF